MKDTRIQFLQEKLVETESKIELLEQRIYALEQILAGFQNTISEHLS